MWPESCRNEVNRQINMEYTASYAYDYLSSYFDRNSVGLKGVAKYFRKASDEEREHAHKLIAYQNMRGGEVVLNNIVLENISLDGCGANDVKRSFEIALDLEKQVYNSLLLLHKAAEDANDPQFADFIESEYLEEQVEAISEIEKYISMLVRIGEDGHGIWEFNNKLE